MSLPALFLRAKRKYCSDGAKPLVSEAGIKAVESKPIRALARRTLLQQSTVLEQAQLRDTAPRHWECDPQNAFNPFDSEVPVPRKTRLPTSGSFDTLDTSLPTNPFVAELQGVVLLAPSGLAITSDSKIVKDTIAPERSSNSRIEKILSRSIWYTGYRNTRKTVFTPEPNADRSLSLATSLVPLWRNYYHWTLECLPKILGVETYREQTGESPTILLPPDPSAWMRESLELVGVDQSNVETLQPGTTRVDRFVVPLYPTPSRTECHWLRKRVHDGINVQEITTGEYPSRIYITRRNANVRRVKNERALLDVLSEYDVKPYALETLTVAEQARLFANADLVVSPHGAGLANLVYGTSPTVLELFGDKEKTTFYRLAKLMGFEYHAMFCDHDKKDILVESEQLDEAIASVLSGDREPVLEACRPESE